MIRLAFVLALASACGSRNDPPSADRPPPPVTPTVTEPPPPPPDAAPPDAPSGPHEVRGYRFSVTAPAEWTVAKPDPVLPGNVMMTGNGPERAYIAMMGLDRNEATNADACRKAATRVPDVRFVSSAIVKKTRFGTACQIVQTDTKTNARIDIGLYNIGERDMLTFMCWSAPDATSSTCKQIFDSIKPEPRS